MSTNPYWTPTLTSAAHLEPFPQQPSIMLTPSPSGSARESCSPANTAAYKLLLSGILQQDSPE
eukprot:1153128-Pelagomonas_calceolata.AAC.2